MPLLMTSSTDELSHVTLKILHEDQLFFRSFIPSILCPIISEKSQSVEIILFQCLNSADNIRLNLQRRVELDQIRSGVDGVFSDGFLLSIQSLRREVDVGVSVRFPRFHLFLAFMSSHPQFVKRWWDLYNLLLFDWCPRSILQICPLYQR